MIGREDIDKLSKLARISISPEEKEVLVKDIDSILSYVGQIGQAKFEADKDDVLLRKNVMREDDNPHEAGIYTAQIIDEAPDSQNGYIKVKNIL